MEKRDLYDKNRSLTGKTIYKGESVPEGSYIVVVLIYIQNSKESFYYKKEVQEKMDYGQLQVDIQNLEKIVFREY